ncbi:MAG: accessory factor UbiK family protein [Alphaproteobacteria bacterium]
MQTDNRFLDDLARLAGSALSSAGAVRDEIEARLRQRLEAMLGGMNLVPRDEFDAVKAMAARARTDTERLEQRLSELEARVAGKASRPKRRGAARAKGRG